MGTPATFTSPATDPVAVSGIVGAAYSLTLVASGDPVIIFNQDSGTFPPGISFDGFNIISGTYLWSGTFSAVFSASNGSGTDTFTLNFTVIPAPARMILPDTNRARLSFRPEVVNNEVPVGALAMLQLRTTGEQFGVVKETVESDEITGDLALVDELVVGKSTKWALEGEMSWQPNLDTLIAAAFGSAWTGTGKAVTGVAATDIFTSASHGYLAGQPVVFSGLTGGAGIGVGRYYVIAANLATNTFQVSATPGGAALNFTTDLTVGTVTRTDLLLNAQTAPSFHFQRDYQDVGISHWWTGNKVDGFVLTLEAKKKVMFKMTGVGIFGGCTGPAQACTATASSDLVSRTAHGFSAGTPVVFGSLTGGAGINAGAIYFVSATGLTADVFQVSATLGGAVLDITSNLTAGTVARSLPYVPTITVSPTAPIFTSGVRVGSFLQDGAALNYAIRKLEVDVKKGLLPVPVLDSLYPAEFGQGDWRVMAKAELYYSDTLLHQKFLDHVPIALGFSMGTLTAPDGKYDWLLGRLQIPKSDPNAPKKNEKVVQALEFSGTTSSTIGGVASVLRTAGT